MDANFAGAVEMCAYLRVAVVGWCRLVPACRRCVPILGLPGVEWCGVRQMRAYLVRAAQIRAHLPVSAAAPFRHPGFARLSPGSCAIGAVPSPGQTAPARAPSLASR